MSDAAEKFKAALAARQSQKAEEEARKANPGGGHFTEVPFSALVPGGERVFRFLGSPYVVREKGTDSKKIWLSLALNDSDKYTRLIGPNPRDDATKNWIMYRVINTVLSYDWDPDANGGKGTKIYKYQEKSPDLFNRVRKNNQMQNKYATGWQFDAAVMFNVIDRQAMDWHKEHKKTRVLSRGCWEKDGKMNFDVGVPDTIYCAIMDDIVATDGNTNWETYDVIVKRLTEKPWYKVQHPIMDGPRITPEALSRVVAGPLSKEEREYELWDFDKLYPISSYKKIMQNFGLTFQKVDKVFGKTFYEELKDLVEQEEKEVTARKAASAESKTDGASDSDAGEIPETQTNTASLASQADPAPQAETAPARTRNPSQNDASTIDWAGLKAGTANGRQYLGIDALTEQEKKWILGLNSDGTFKFAPEAGELLQDTQDKMFCPEQFHCNPYSGRVY